MSQKKLPNTRQLSLLANRLRIDAEALVVLVIRVDDVAFAVDPAVSPKDAASTVEGELPAIVQRLADSRKKDAHAIQGK